MKNTKTIIKTAAMMVFTAILLSFSAVSTVKAAAITASSGECTQNSTSIDDLASYIRDTIDGDSERLSKLPAALEKLFKKAIKLYEKAGILSDNIKRVLDLYRALDETAPDYPEKLSRFLNEYNSLADYEKKIFSVISGFFSAKDELLANIRIITVDLYSTLDIRPTIAPDGKFPSSIDVGDETIAKVNESTGILTPVSVGITSISVKMPDSDTPLTYRIIVKKPLLSSATIKINKGDTIVITLPADSSSRSVHVSNKKITVSLDGSRLTVTSKKTGKSYVYVGSENGHTLKYRINSK